MRQRHCLTAFICFLWSDAFFAADSREAVSAAMFA